MSDDTHEAADERVTSPMQEFTGTDVIAGFVVFVIGMFLVGALPYLF